MDSNLKAYLETKLSLNPAKSQIYLIILLLLSFLLTGLGIFFLWHDKLIGLLPAIAGLILIVISIVGWFFSQKSIDLDQCIPTTIMKDSNGMKVSTDSRSLNSKQMMQGLIGLMESINTREKLPEPDGLVAENGSVCADLDSLKKANEMTNHINQQAKEINHEAASSLESAFLVRNNDKTINEIMADGAAVNKMIIDNK
ncbi:hypothetical protein [Providencia sp. Je.9.19]|uniref:hypothetical protein n=1 Tax=Providencia sp. Je.9.19 TaxID=3142844 RepID=UPI003DA80B54